MIDQMMESFRKATETTLQMQQQMYRQWSEQWLHVPWTRGVGGMPGLEAGPAAAWLEQLRSFQKQMAGSVTEMLRKHRDTLDTQYAAGLRTIEEAFRVGEAKDPEQLRTLTEGLWKQSFDCLRTVSEGQMKEFQKAVEVWFENVSKGGAAMKV